MTKLQAKNFRRRARRQATATNVPTVGQGASTMTLNLFNPETGLATYVTGPISQQRQILELGEVIQNLTGAGA